MGQKVSPLSIRIGYIKNWISLWFDDKNQYAKNVYEDAKIREHIRKNFAQAAVAKIVIERLADKIHLKVSSARPGVIIGRRGADIDRLRSDLEDITKRDIAIDIEEIKNPATSAQLVAQNVAFQLEKRVAHRRAIKRAIDQSLNAGVKGIKITCAGRLGGHEMSRRETYHRGKIPLQTFRANIDYGFAESFTTYGVLGVKAWIYHGDTVQDKPQEEERPKKAAKK